MVDPSREGTPAGARSGGDAGQEGSSGIDGERIADELDDALRRMREGDDDALERIARLAEGKESASNEDSGGDARAWAEGLAGAPSALVNRRPGDRFGRYVLGRFLGRGGAGVVYEAQLENPRRSVALKILRGGIDADPAEKIRFAREARSLALLRHPAIATLYDAGVVDGVSYLALDLVRGQPLDAYCRQNELSVEERLSLFDKVLDGVGYAHRRGVIHRDLKPTNILVDSEQRPRILDFGLARLQEPDPSDSLRTEASAWLGTLPYMSPEQVQGDVQEVDTRTDVYGLGVLLYELIARRRPLDPSRERPLEAVRMIAEIEPPPVSDWVEGVDPDLDTIVLKSLAKDPDQRYSSVDEFRADLTRFRTGFPILARERGAWYRFKKFARRRSKLVLFLAMTALVVLASIIGLVLSLDRAMVAENGAALEASRALEALRYLEGFIADVDPNRTPDPDLKVRQLVSTRTPERLGSEVEDLVVRAALHGVLGRVHTSFGEFELASKHLDRAVEIGRQGSLNMRGIARALRDLAFLRHAQRKFEESERLQREALALRIEALPPGHAEILQSREELAELLFAMGDIGESVSLRRTNSAEAELSGVTQAVKARTALAGILLEVGEFEEADRILSEGHMLRDGATWRSVARARIMMVRALKSLGRYRDSVRSGIDLCDDLVQKGHGQTLVAAEAQVELHLSACEAGAFDVAVRAAMSAVEVRTRLLGDHHPQTHGAYQSVVRALFQSGQFERAIQYGERFVADIESAQASLGQEVVAIAHILGNAHLYLRDEVASLGWSKMGLELAERLEVDSSRAWEMRLLVVDGLLAVASDEDGPVRGESLSAAREELRLLIGEGSDEIESMALRVAVDYRTAHILELSGSADEAARSYRGLYDDIVTYRSRFGTERTIDAPSPDLLIALARLAMARGDAVSFRRWAAEADQAIALNVNQRARALLQDRLDYLRQQWGR